jgi:glyoxylase-like metal-dependent hydrolase (beta-lactamase superfamily II)
MKILDPLWQVGGDDLSAAGDAAIYLVRFGPEAVLIDAGCGPGHWQVVNNIALCLPPEVNITFLLLTHCHYDHTGGAPALRDQYGCKIIAHEKDAEFLEKGDNTVTAAAWYGARITPFCVDTILMGSTDTIAVGSGAVTAYHCPGHTPGSVVFTTELADRKVLFGQDIHGPLHPTFLSNRQAYRQSLEFILDLDADILCEGHFGVIRGKNAVKKFIRSYL